MKWTKLKQRIESGFAASVLGRAEVWSTRYRRSHDQEGEGWVTFDGRRVHSSASLSFFKEQNQRVLQRSGLDTNPEHRDEDSFALYWENYHLVEAELRADGIARYDQFTTKLFDYLNTPFEDTLCSEDAIIRALGMLDKRLGKRRLLRIDESDASELVQSFYQFRCTCEGISTFTQS